MSTALTDTPSQAVSTLSPEALAIIKADEERMVGSRIPQIPQIKLANKDAKQAPEGEYFIETYKGKDEDREIRVLGPNPEIVILYKTNTYSYSVEGKGLLAWTTDIHGFTNKHRVTLFVRREGKVDVAFDGSYPDFKRYAEAKYTVPDPVDETAKPKKLLKFQTVLYVLFEGRPHKMYVSNASNAGVDDRGNPSFDDPHPRSLQTYTEACWNEGRALYREWIRLGSLLVTNDPEDEVPNKIYAPDTTKIFYVMTFEPIGPLDDATLNLAAQQRVDAEKAVRAIDDFRRSEAPARTAEAAAPVAPADDLPDFEAPEVTYTSEVKVEDLPF